MINYPSCMPPCLGTPHYRPSVVNECMFCAALVPTNASGFSAVRFIASELSTQNQMKMQCTARIYRIRRIKKTQRCACISCTKFAENISNIIKHYFILHIEMDEALSSAWWYGLCAPSFFFFRFLRVQFGSVRSSRSLHIMCDVCALVSFFLSLLFFILLSLSLLLLMWYS